MPRWLRPGRGLDAVLVVSVLVLDLVFMIVATTDPDVELAHLSAGGVLLAIAGAGALWWRRRAPLLVLAAVLTVQAVAAGVLGAGLASHTSGLLAVLALFAVGAWSERRWAPWIVLGVTTVLVFAALRDDGQEVAQAAAAAAGFVGLPIVAGRAARAQRRQIAEATRRAVADERAHIARELHDVVAHHVSLIGVQAGAARVALDDDPSTAHDALLAIERSSREAVGQMRHLLDVLRSDGTTPPLTPLPVLADLDHLADGFRQAGVAVDIDVRLDVEPDRAVQLVCYRLVEEALTNVARHSASGCADVAVTAEDGCVRVAIHDPGPARSGTTDTGRGHVGMAERVALFGGRLDVGQDAAGGFVVEAELPVPP
jgi:signal transduction histidine kinase